MPRKAQMNANYRKNERLLEDGQIDIPESGGVSQQYVDTADAATLAEAKEYTDDEIAGIEIPEYTAGTGISIANGVITNTQPNVDELPQIVSGDAGKVLKVNAGESGVEWGEVSKELPAISSGDAGKVLQVNAGETGVEWGNAGGAVYTAGTGISITNGVITNTAPNVNELPQIASGDAGKVLKVNSRATGVEWGTAGGGSGNDPILNAIKVDDSTSYVNLIGCIIMGEFPQFDNDYSDIECGQEYVTDVEDEVLYSRFSLQTVPPLIISGINETGGTVQFVYEDPETLEQTVVDEKYVDLYQISGTSLVTGSSVSIEISTAPATIDPEDLVNIVFMPNSGWFQGI